MERAGVDGRFAGVLRFPGDVLGMFDCGFDVPPRGVIEVVGEGGTLVAEDPWHGLAPRLTRDGEEIPVQAANPYRLELEDLSAAIRTGREPRLGRADAVGQARAIEALYAAAELVAAIRILRSWRSKWQAPDNFDLSGGGDTCEGWLLAAVTAAFVLACTAQAAGAQQRDRERLDVYTAVVQADQLRALADQGFELNGARDVAGGTEVQLVLSKGPARPARA